MNNFNTSDTGTNIELDLFYCGDTAKSWFGDSFTTVSSDSFSLLNSSYRGVTVYAYDIPDFELFNLDNWIIPSKKDLYKIILDELFNACVATFNTETKAQFDKYSYQLTKNELLEFLADTYEPDYHDFIVNYFTLKYGIVSSRGHCQGDYVEVIYNKTDFTNTPDFDNEIWNSPVYGRLLINDLEFYIDQEMKDIYNYDSDEILEIATKLINASELENKAQIIEQVEEMIPRSIEYR
jgi:hypothetical protein